MKSKSHVDGFSIIVNAISKVLGLDVDEINLVAEESTFVKLGGDSLAAILVAAECQKISVSVPASVFLRGPNLKECIAKAESSAQLLRADSTALSTPAPAPPLLRPQFPELPAIGSSSHSTTERDGFSWISSSCDAAIPTLNLQASDTLSCYNGQNIITAINLLDRINATEWTEMQLLLLRETSNDRKRNILTIHNMYTGEWDPQHVCNVWTNTILVEPIFQDLIIELGILPHQLLLQKIIRVETQDEFQRELRGAVLVDHALSHLTVIQLRLSSVAVVWRVHHFFMDGFSACLLCDKIRRNLLEGLPTASIGPSFKHTVRALGRLREAMKEATRRFWDSKRAKFSSAVGELCLSPQRAHDGSTSQQLITIPLPEAELAAARARTGITTTAYFAAAWALTLGKFMNTDQVYFGVTLSGRDLPILGAFDVVGPLINVLPLFVQLPVEDDRETSALAFLRGIQDGLLELNDFQYPDTTDGVDRQFTSIMATQFEEYEGSEQFPLGDSNHLDMQSGYPLNLIIQGQSRLHAFYSPSHYSKRI